MIRINHIGIVVKSIEEYLKNGWLPPAGKIVYDPVQDSRLLLAGSEGNMIELIEPVSEKATTYNFLQKTGGGLHHVCFEVGFLEEAEKIIAEKKAVKFFGPVPARLFNGRKVLFVYSRNREIVEFLITGDA